MLVRRLALTAILAGLAGLAGCTVYHVPPGYQVPPAHHRAAYSSTYAPSSHGYYGEPARAPADRCDCRCGEGPYDPYARADAEAAAELEGDWSEQVRDRPADLLE